MCCSQSFVVFVYKVRGKEVKKGGQLNENILMEWKEFGS